MEFLKAVLALGEAVQKGGVVFVLTLALAGVSFAWWHERKDRKELSTKVIAGAERMTEVVSGVQTTVASFRDTMNVVIALWGKKEGP